MQAKTVYTTSTMDSIFHELSIHTWPSQALTANMQGIKPWLNIDIITLQINIKLSI